MTRRNDELRYRLKKIKTEKYTMRELVEMKCQRRCDALQAELQESQELVEGLQKALVFVIKQQVREEGAVYRTIPELPVYFDF